MPKRPAYNDIEVEDHGATNHRHDDQNQNVNQSASVRYQAPSCHKLDRAQQ